MKAPYSILIALAGLASAFLTYVGVKTLDVVLAVTTLVYLVVAPFTTPLPRPVNYVYNAIGAVLLAIFAYLVTMRVMMILGV